MSYLRLPVAFSKDVFLNYRVSGFFGHTPVTLQKKQEKYHFSL